MIDIHCHIIPGVDDGSEDMEESLDMGQLASEFGTTDIIVTPHCNIPDVFDNYHDEEYEEAFMSLSIAFQRNNIPITLHRGMEVFGVGDIGSLIEDGRLITLAGSRYMLIEFPFDAEPGYIQDVLWDVSEHGVTPIVAHPERYYAVIDDIEYALDWVGMGCFLQLNRTSIMGNHGDDEMHTSRMLLKQKAAHFIASDAHSAYTRTPRLADVYSFIADRYSKRWADILLVENPQRVIEDRDLLVLE